MKLFILWLKPEPMRYYKQFDDGDELHFLFVPYFQAFEGALPLNVCDDVPIYTTTN